MAAPARLRYTDRDFDSIKTALSEFVQATRPQDWNDFFDGNLGETVMDLVAFMGDVGSFGIDMMHLEQWSSVARRYETMLRFADSVGYAPRSATSATVVVRADPLPDTIVTNGGSVPSGTTIVGTNGLVYELETTTLIGSGESVATLTLKQGQTVTDIFTVSQQANQEFTTEQGVVENASWQVFVGDPSNPSNEWTQVSNVAFETSDTETYDVSFEADGRLVVRFGDGTAGKIPDQDVTIIYRVTDGASGNSGVGTVKGAVTVDVLGGSGTTVSVTFSNAAAATGGLSRESVDDLRLSIPNFLRTVEKITTITDYEDAVPKNTAVALVHADQPLASYSGNVIRLHAWDVEATDFTATSPLSGESSTAAYDRYAQIPTTRLNEVQLYLLSRTLATVRTVIIRPLTANVDLEFGNVVYDGRFNKAEVHVGITAAVVGVFQSSSGFAIRLADLYRGVLSVSGVRHFEIGRMVFEHINFDNPVAGVTVTDDYRRDTDPTGAAGGPYDPPQDLLVPGTEDRVFYVDSHRYTNEFTYQGEIDNSGVQAINLRSLTFDLVIS